LCQLGAGQGDVCGGSFRIPRIGNQLLRTRIGYIDPARASGLEEIALIGDILQGIILAEVLLDALAQYEKPQDREDDHDDADDVDDAVHELTL
jgi:hypothetical protein